MSASLKIEEIVEGIVRKRVERHGPPTATSYFSQRETRFRDQRAKFAMENLNSINANIGSLLTHISAMIAALSIILIVFGDSVVTQFFIFLEMIIYTLLAVMCVYCLRHEGGFVPLKEFEENIEEIETIYNYYLNRRYIYTLCSNGVTINTFFFLLTVFVHAVSLFFSR